MRPTKYAVHTRIIVEEKEVNQLPPQHPEKTNANADDPDKV